MIDTKSFKIGDTVYLSRYISWTSEVATAEIIHTTPTGRLKVKRPNGFIIEFKKTGDEMTMSNRPWRIIEKETYDRHIRSQQMNQSERQIKNMVSELDKMSFDKMLDHMELIKNAIELYKTTYQSE